MITAEVNDLVHRLSIEQEKVFQNFIYPNEKAITSLPHNEQEMAYKEHDAIVGFINYQTDIINYLLLTLEKRPTQAQYEFNKRHLKQALYYIEQLGGNANVLSYIKPSDYVS